MTELSKDTGVIAVLLQRMETQRLPRALALKEKVGQGEQLDEFDIEFLKEVFADANEIKSIVKQHPEYQALAARVVHLYKEIMDKAMENEEKS
ncbi:MAG: hypothetical protein GY807_20665 [Gammaproteobacteria bacterium]|nr:hypothetical protein [Gammaproteobacteria bacterium]